MSGFHMMFITCSSHMLQFTDTIPTSVAKVHVKLSSIMPNKRNAS